MVPYKNLKSPEYSCLLSRVTTNKGAGPSPPNVWWLLPRRYSVALPRVRQEAATANLVGRTCTVIGGVTLLKKPEYARRQTFGSEWAVASARDDRTICASCSQLFKGKQEIKEANRKVSETGLVRTYVCRAWACRPRFNLVHSGPFKRTLASSGHALIPLFD